MSLLLYEMKKMFFHQKGWLVISLFFVLSMATLIVFDTPNNSDIETNSSQYSFYQNQLNGPYSEEKEQFFADESKRISDANVALEKAYNYYYDGIISENELLTALNPLERIVQNESGFKLIFDQYTYVRENPENRYFLNTNGWDGLLSTDRLDLFFLLLLLALVTPVFCYEYESEMDSLNLTVKKGTRGHAISKIGLVLLTVVILCLLTSGLRYGFFQMKYGLENGSYPLQSLTYFGTSVKDITLFSTFLSVTAIKIFGNLCFAMLIMFVSVCTKKYAPTLFTCTAIILLPYYGFSLESSKYFLPGALGSIVATGYFRGGEYEYNIFTDQMDLLFKEVSTTAFLILFVVTLCLSISAFIVIMINHTNVWRTKKRNRLPRTVSLVLILSLVVSNLVGCISNKNIGSYDIYNSSSRQSFENEHYRFYVDETNLSDSKLVFKDKKTGETRNLVRNPMQSLTTIATTIYGNGSFVYYLKTDYDKSGFYKMENKISVIEVDTTTFNERVIFERNVNTNRDSFLGLNKSDDDDLLSFIAIGSFFVDDQSIYFVDEGEIKQVNRTTGKSTVNIRYPVLRSVAFDGHSIYYINEKYEVAKYDTATNSETIVPNLITTYFVLTDTELLFVNRKDKHKIYAMNLDDFTVRKITDQSVLSFTCDDLYIFYENSTDLKKYRIDRDGQNNTLLNNDHN